MFRRAAPIAAIASVLALLPPAGPRVLRAFQPLAPRILAVAPCSTVEWQGRCVAAAPCAEGELELNGVCLPLRSDAPNEPSAEAETNAHTDRMGRLVVYEHVPRRPDLPENYNLYVYPTEPWGGTTVTSGYDLGRPDALQRRGRNLSAVGHGGVDLPNEVGAPVRAIALRGEAGTPEVLHAGWLFGNTVVLRHLLRDGGTLRSYVAIHGHLDRIAPGIERGRAVEPGTVIGFVGDSGAEGTVHLHYEIRVVRAGVDPMRIEPASRAVSQEFSVPCDPRNVLPMRAN